jgi:hypothetical protein
MHAAIVAVAFALNPCVELNTRFWGVTPAVGEVDSSARLVPKHDKAVVLVHGLVPHVFFPEKAEKSEAHDWQMKGGKLVKALADEFDVYGFSYAQTRSVDDVVFARGLKEGLEQVKAAGYKEVVLVGHSAGGIVARRVVEVYPDVGVTKVIAVATPFHGSGWAKVPEFTVPKTQVAFVHSLSPDVREEMCKECEGALPKGLEFCCVVCKLQRLDSDTVVGVKSQWPDGLQKAGVPAVVAVCNHFEAMNHDAVIKEVTKLVGGKVVRWDDDKTATARKVLFGEEKKK